MAHLQRQASMFNSGSQGSTPQRYKAVTRELLLSVCKKHFAHKAYGASISGSNREAKAAAKLAAHHGAAPEDFTGTATMQTRMESLEHYLKRATHLQLDHLKLTHTHVVPELAQLHQQPPNDRAFEQAKNVRVLYLHDNQLTTIDDFSFCKTSLSHLYLQSNQITHMRNLLDLSNLEKLYLGNNKIALLEGFAREELEMQQHEQEEEEAEHHQQQQHHQQDGDGTQEQKGDGDDRQQQLQQQQHHQPRPAPARSPVNSPAPFYLVELHMDSQRLPANSGGLQLSIPSIQALSHSLIILSLSNNFMDSDSILPISLLGKLTNLNLSHNKIDDVKLAAEMCSYLNELTILDLRENPLNSGVSVTSVVHKKYRDRIIMSSRSITLLDEKAVPDNQREYLHSLSAQKRLKRQNAAREAGQSAPAMSPEEAKFAALHAPPAFPYAPKVLTLRTHPQTAGAINIGQVGAFGATMKHKMSHGGGGGGSVGGSSGNAAAYVPHTFQTTHASSSPFLDDDPNLGGGGGGGFAGAGYGYGPGGENPFNDEPDVDVGGLAISQSQQSQPSQQSEEADPIPGAPFTGSTARLDYLLQHRSLVSAVGQPGHNESGDPSSVDGTSAESARARRATMNQMNARPQGWDGGRTQTIPTAHSRNSSSIGHTRKDSSPPRAHSRTSSKVPPK